MERREPFRKLLERPQNVNANTRNSKVSQVLSISRLEYELNFNAAFSRAAHKKSGKKEAQVPKELESASELKKKS